MHKHLAYFKRIIRKPNVQLSLLFLLVISVHALSTGAQAPPVPIVGAACPAAGQTGITPSGIAVTCTQVPGGGNLVWTNIASPGIGAQTNVANTFTAPQNFDANFASKGPNPYVDVTRYGVRPILFNQIPSATGITATINSGSPNATVSTSSCPGQVSSVCFINGDGVVIYGAGATHSLATPTCTVTPAIAAGGTRTGIIVNGPTGATTYNYKVVAVNKSRGTTAASATCSTTTGASALGRQSLTISTLTRSGNVTTVTTSSAHSLPVGCAGAACAAMVYIATTSDDINFGGWFGVASVADNTHFTFLSNLDTNNGAPTSATGGNAVWFNANRITISQVTGAWQYCVYTDRAGGGMVPLACGMPQGNGTLTDLTLDDFGSPMMDNYKLPAWLPATPPVSAISNELVTTILSGAGTTALTLASNAGTSVAGATIRFDNAPNILTAANAAKTTASGSGGLLHFPVSTVPFGAYTVNSYLILPTNLAVSFTTGLFLNDTVEVSFGSSWYGNIIPQGYPPPSFAQGGGASIAVSEASPGIYTFNDITNWERLNFNAPGVLNGALLAFLDQVSPDTFDFVSFSTSTGANDYMGIGLVLRGDAVGVGNSSYVNLLSNVLFTGGPAQSNGITATPFMYCNGCGLTEFSNLNLSVRGIFFRPVAAGGTLKIDTGRQQGGLMPTVMYYNTGATAITSNVIRSFEQDTTAHAIFANMLGAASLLQLEGAGVAGVVAGAQGTLVTGLPIRSVTAFGIPYTGFNGINTKSDILATGFAIDGVINPITSGAYASREFNSGLSIGPAYSIFAKGAAPAIGTATVSAGGAISIGNHTYKVVPVWWNGAEGLPSAASNQVTTSSGQQTVTVTWTAVAGNPKGYDVYQDGILVSLGVGGNCTTIPQYAAIVTSAVISSFTCGSGTTVQAGGPTMLNVNGIFAPQVVTGQVISNTGTVCSNGELALSAGWQSTGSATVTAVAGTGQTCSWTVTTGTTTAANPTITDTLTNALPAATTVCELNIHGGTHTAAAGEGFQQTTLSATAPVFTFNGTPTAGGTTYFVTRRCGP